MNDDFSGQDQPAQLPERKRRGGRFAIIVVAVLAVIGVSVGVVMYLDHQAEVAAAERQERAERRAEAKERREERQQAAAIRRENQATYDACVDETSPLQEALSTLDARLDVGLDIDEYSDLVGDASVAYDQLDIDAVNEDCIRAAVPLENALRKYISVASTWDDCVFDDFCSMDDIEAGMQSKWASAARLVQRSSNSLEDLDPAATEF